MLAAFLTRCSRGGQGFVGALISSEYVYIVRWERLAPIKEEAVVSASAPCVLLFLSCCCCVVVLLTLLLLLLLLLFFFLFLFL